MTEAAGSPLAQLDPVGFGEALVRAGLGVASRPIPAAVAGIRFGGRLAVAAAEAAARTVGLRPGPALAPEKQDRRWTDPAWDRNPWFYAQRQAYLAWSALVREVVARADLDATTRRKAELAAGFLVRAAAPTNFLPGNPTALRRAVQTGGLSVLGGLRNFVDDQLGNGGRPRQVDHAAFELGRDLAATPGRVVHRNDLMELIQYEAQTPTVHEVPLVLSPPWINRYYVMDLSPGRSFVEWAVRHGHTVFAISYRNPDSSLRSVDLADYLDRSLGEALAAVADITGAPEANVAGLCIGGTLAGMLLADDAARQVRRVRSVTLLNTLLDFREPGVLGAFTDEASVARMEQRAAASGLVRDRDLATTFDLLRDDDLVWGYVARNWLMGESPPPFDVLAWNRDGVNLPARMMSTYLRTCYLGNDLAEGRMRVHGRALRLGAVDVPAYVVAARRDHIVPWRSSYAGARLLGGPVRFVLTSSGHIAGIVNPPPTKRSPPTKRRYWTGAEGDLGDDPGSWLSAAEQHPGSWWDDWTPWIEARAGAPRQPPPTGSPAYPAREAAPGTYIRT